MISFIKVHPKCPNSHAVSSEITINKLYVVNIKDSAAGCIISLINREAIMVKESYESIVDLLE